MKDTIDVERTPYLEAEFDCCYQRVKELRELAIWLPRSQVTSALFNWKQVQCALEYENGVLVCFSDKTFFILDCDKAKFLKWMEVPDEI